MTRTLVVVGFGMVGHRLLAQLRDHDASGVWRTVVLAEEKYPAYNRVALSSYLVSRAAQDLTLVDQQLLDDPLVELQLGSLAIHIDRAACTVTTSSGRVYGYDALVLATGSRPFVPPVPGCDLPGCFTYRTLDDLDAIRAAAGSTPGAAGVVIGGGLLGLEAAGALRLLDLTPHVVGRAPHLMPTQVDSAGAEVLNRLIRRTGLRVHCGTSVTSIESDRGGLVYSVRLTDGTILDTRLVILSAGIRPRDELAADAGLATVGQGGILVDRYCHTADARIWAIGDCAAVHGRTYGLVAPGYRMADAVAAQLLGSERSLDHVDTATNLKLLGLDVASFGDAHATTPGSLQLRFVKHHTDTYAKLVWDAGGRVLLGGILIGDTSAYPRLRSLLGRELPVSPREALFGVARPCGLDTSGGAAE